MSHPSTTQVEEKAPRATPGRVKRLRRRRLVGVFLALVVFLALAVTGISQAQAGEGHDRGHKSDHSKSWGHKDRDHDKDHGRHKRDRDHDKGRSHDKDKGDKHQGCKGDKCGPYKCKGKCEPCKNGPGTCKKRPPCKPKPPVRHPRPHHPKPPVVTTPPPTTSPPTTSPPTTAPPTTAPPVKTPEKPERPQLAPPVSIKRPPAPPKAKPPAERKAPVQPVRPRTPVQPNHGHELAMTGPEHEGRLSLPQATALLGALLFAIAATALAGSRRFKKGVKQG